MLNHAKQACSAVVPDADKRERRGQNVPDQNPQLQTTVQQQRSARCVQIDDIDIGVCFKPVDQPAVILLDEKIDMMPALGQSQGNVSRDLLGSLC